MSVVEKFRTMEYGPAPEDPKESLQWLERHKRKFGHFIGGAWKAPADGKYFETSDPSTGEKIADVAQGSAADVDAAVKAARAALKGWQALTGHERAKLFVCAGAAGTKTFAAVGRTRDDRQRQAHSREPRH